MKRAESGQAASSRSANARGKDLAIDTAAQEEKIRALIDAYVKACNTADADLLESLFWLDDPRFSEVENDRGEPFGADEFREIADWIRAHAQPGEKQRCYDTHVYLLTPEVAYSVSLRDEIEEGTTSRVTFVYLRRGDEWRIVHAHFSYLPE